MSILLDKPEQWRKRATEARTLAKAMKDPEAQSTMQQIAAAYDQRAAQRAKQSG